MSEAGEAADVRVRITCAEMTDETRSAAMALLGAFLRDDDHYLASSEAYGDGGPEALARALDLFLLRPEIGFVWLAFAGDDHGHTAVGACVVCHAISTSKGTLVAKLDDVTIGADWQGRGVGGAMMDALVARLRSAGVTRIDTACHRENAGAWRFYERHGFRALDEERIARVID
jgi:GNAT superfamily N-acetyltransferase